MHRIALLLLPVFFVLTSPAAWADKPLSIGVIAPMSGPAAEYGRAVYNGIALAGQEHQADGVEFLFEDTPYDSKAAVAAFHKFHQIDRVDAVYVVGVSFCDAVAPLAQQTGVQMVAQCVQRNVARGRSNVVRFFSYADQYASSLAAHLRRKKLKKIGVVLSENPYLEEMFRALEQNKDEQQELFVLGRFQPSDMDFRALAAKIKLRRPDALAVLLADAQIPQFYRQIREQRIDIPTVGSNFFESAELLRASGGAMDGAVYAANYLSAEFCARYRSVYGNTSQITFAAFAYEFARLAARARRASRANSPLLELLPAAAYGSSVVGGALYRESEEMGKYFDFTIVLKQVVNGAPEILSFDDTARARFRE